MKYRSREIGGLDYRIALKFDSHVGSSAADMPVKFQSDRTSLNTNLVVSRFCEILQQDVLSDIEIGLRPLPISQSGIIRLLSIWPLGTNFSEIWIIIQNLIWKKCIWKCRLQNVILLKPRCDNTCSALALSKLTQGRFNRRRLSVKLTHCRAYGRWGCQLQLVIIKHILRLDISLEHFLGNCPQMPSLMISQHWFR